MKFDKQKAFPYPVLRPQSDDYNNAEFQTIVDIAVGKEKAKVDISYTISSKEIVEEIHKGNAEYVSIFSCRDTYFRMVLSTKGNHLEADFNLGDLRGEVKIDSYVVVRKEITAFSSPDINPEFGSEPFDFSIGDILAQDEPQIFYIDRDMFKPITSVFDLVKKDELSNGEWTIGFEDDHIQIEVSPKMKETIDDARNIPNNRVILTNSIYFIAVMQAVQKLKSSESEFEGRKWAEVIMRQSHNLGCDLENHDAYLITERLMHYPLIKLEQYIFKGKDR